jgi:hypothetical protein
MPPPAVVNVWLTVEPSPLKPLNVIDTGNSDGATGSAKSTEISPNALPLVRLNIK